MDYFGLNFQIVVSYQAAKNKSLANIAIVMLNDWLWSYSTSSILGTSDSDIVKSLRRFR